ncbi:MAG: B12-binding domain-containing radical SAM protein, partial [Verrucomicrobiota bacterium]
EEARLEPREVANALWRDWQRPGRIEIPIFLRDYISETLVKTSRSPTSMPKRQARHLTPAG